MDHQRMLDKEHEPTEEEIVSTVGQAAAAWLDVRRYIEENWYYRNLSLCFPSTYGGSDHHVLEPVMMILESVESLERRSC